MGAGKGNAFIQSIVPEWFKAEIQEHVKTFMLPGTDKRYYRSVSDLIRVATEAQIYFDKHGDESIRAEIRDIQAEVEPE